MESYRTICRGCHGGCAVRVYLDDGVLQRISPITCEPFSGTSVCVKGVSVSDFIYSNKRITEPLKRVGERGSGQWRPVSWDDALCDIAERLQDVAGRLGPEAVVLAQGTGRHHYLHVVRFANQLGTPNWYEPGCANCFIPRITVSNLTYGGFVSADYYGETLPETILFWGNNALVSNPDGKLSHGVQKAMKAGADCIAIDPRRSETGKKCSMWLPVRPGTDDALALAMIHVIIYEKVYDAAFVECWTHGFDELKEHVRDFTPAWAEPITGVSASLIREAAIRYAVNKPSVIEWGVSIEQNPNSLQTVRAVAILRGLTGNIDVPGSDILGMHILKPYPVMKQNIPPERLKKRLGAEEFKLLGGFRAFMPSAHIPAIYNAIINGDPYPVKAMMLWGHNPLSTVAQTPVVYEALQKLEFLVATDFFMTPSAHMADYFLPAAAWPEVNQIVEMPYVTENAVFAQQKILQVGKCRQDEEIMIELARRMKLPGAEIEFTDILNGRLEPLSLNFEELKERFFVYPPHRYRKYEERGFRTPSKKVELFSKGLQRQGYDPLPTYCEPPESPLSTPELAKAYPFVLTTGARRKEYFHSEGKQNARLRKRRPDPLAEMHPNVAASHKIKDGDWVTVASPRGRMKARARVTEDIADRVINVDMGWWFPEKQKDGFGFMESNANMLTSAEAPYDPAFGSYQLRGLLCSVEKIL